MGAAATRTRRLPGCAAMTRCVWVEPTKFSPFWAVTKHADIIEIEKNPAVFASGPRPILIPEQTQPELREELVVEIFKRLEDRPKLLEVLATAGEQGLIRSLVQMDPPDHTSYRALVQPWFKPSNIKALEERLKPDHPFDHR